MFIWVWGGASVADRCKLSVVVLTVGAVLKSNGSGCRKEGLVADRWAWTQRLPNSNTL
jgi:hypothetical protein